MGPGCLLLFEGCLGQDTVPPKTRRCPPGLGGFHPGRCPQVLWLWGTICCLALLVCFALPRWQEAGPVSRVLVWRFVGRLVAAKSFLTPSLG